MQDMTSTPVRPLGILSLPHHYRSPQNLLNPYYEPRDPNYYPSKDADENDDDTPELSLFEGLYLLLLSGAGVSLGYLAADLSWPANFAPLIGLSVLLYLIMTHRSALSPPSPLRIRLSESQVDEELGIQGEMREKSAKGVRGGNEEVRAILAQKRPGAVAGVYAFGRAKPGMGGGGAGQVWVIVEDMDA